MRNEKFLLLISHIPLLILKGERKMTFIKCPFCFRKHYVHKDAGGTYINCPRLEGLHHYLSKTYISFDGEVSDEVKTETAPTKFIQLKLEI